MNTRNLGTEGNIRSDQATDAAAEHCNCRGMATELGRSIREDREQRERREEKTDALVVMQHTDMLQSRQQESWAKPGKLSAIKITLK